MKLQAFQVKNYRSINDSGLIELRSHTALVGRNESGKTNLLLALQSLNPPEGVKELSFEKDFPRDRPVGDFYPYIPVVHTQWELSEQERRELANIFPRGRDVMEVTVGRNYRPPIWVVFGTVMRNSD